MMDTGSRNELLTSLYEKHYDYLIKMACRYVGYDQSYFSFIEDCEQDVFVEATESYSKLKNHPNLLGWLIKACQFRLLHEREKRVRRRTTTVFSTDILDNLSVSEGIDIIRQWNDREDARANLDAIFIVLTEKERHVYEDYFIGGMSEAKVAHKQNVEVSAVKATIRRIRHKSKSLAAKTDRHYFFAFFILHGILFRFRGL